MRRSFPALCLCLTIGVLPALAGTPQKDQALYKDYPLLERERQEEEARDRFLAEAKGEPYKQAEPKAGKRLSLDFSRLDRPHAVSDFKAIWHNPPKRQWWTNTCWCFSTTSFLESEIHRLHGKDLKLSEMYTVYWEYVEKVREFVRTKGTSLVAEGSESNAVLARWKQYGIVPEKDFTGLKPGETVFNHERLIGEITSYLDYVKKQQLWNEEQVLGSLHLILDKHLGKPPVAVKVDGRNLTPKEYLEQVVKLDLEAYVEPMSTLSEPFWQMGEYKFPDNWWHSKDYLNVPLDDWYAALKGAVEKGYTVAIGGDVSEPGYDGDNDIAIVPSYDIPQEAIDQSSREFRIDNHTSDDDHGLHIVGLVKRNGRDWFLVRDSARSGQRGVPGYYFYRDDYVRLKMLTFMVHRDAIKPLLEKAKASR
ncbi:MAG: Aminopeptidase [Holophagaceae bacterium]|nr:Aminopeptidase [Holophagaceae bacterium]